MKYLRNFPPRKNVECNAENPQPSPSSRRGVQLSAAGGIEIMDQRVEYEARFFSVLERL